MLVLSQLHIVFGILESLHQSAISSSSDSAPFTHNAPDVPTPVLNILYVPSAYSIPFADLGL